LLKTCRSLLVAPLLCLALSCSDDSTSPPPPPDPVEAGDIITWAGTGHAGYDGDNHDRLETQFYWPMDIEFTPDLGAFVTDWNNHRIRQVGGDDRFQTVIGRNSDGDGPPLGETQSDLVAPGLDGDLCELNHPTQVFERSNGKLVIVCWHNHKLREWDPATGKVMVLMGRGPGCSGDGQISTAATALLNQAPHAVEAADHSIYINDQRNQVIRKIDPSGVVSTVAGIIPTGNCAIIFPDGAFEGDNGPPASAKFNQPSGSNPNPPGGGLAFDAQQNLYIADTLNHRIRKIDAAFTVITTVVGTGEEGYGGDGGDPLQAKLNTPLDIAFGPDGRLYIADMYNNRVRAVDFTANVITTVAGNGHAGFSGDRYPATDAKLNRPYGVGFDADGNLYIADTYNQRIRKVLMH
jgi:serine/threonine-protein kinase